MYLSVHMCFTISTFRSQRLPMLLDSAIRSLTNINTYILHVIMFYFRFIFQRFRKQTRPVIFSNIVIIFYVFVLRKQAYTSSVSLTDSHLSQLVTSPLLKITYFHIFITLLYCDAFDEPKLKKKQIFFAAQVLTTATFVFLVTKKNCNVCTVC